MKGRINCKVTFSNESTSANSIFIVENEITKMLKYCMNKMENNN